MLSLRISSLDLISSKSPSSYLRLLHRLPVILSFPCIFLSITCFRRRCFLFEFTVLFSFLQSHLAAAYVFFLVSPSFYPSLYFLSITCFRRQFLGKLWPIQLVFLVLLYCRKINKVNGHPNPKQHVLEHLIQQGNQVYLQSTAQTYVHPC